MKKIQILTGFVMLSGIMLLPACNKVGDVSGAGRSDYICRGIWGDRNLYNAKADANLQLTYCNNHGPRQVTDDAERNACLASKPICTRVP